MQAKKKGKKKPQTTRKDIVALKNEEGLQNC